jgi:hypothetical protein
LLDDLTTGIVYLFFDFSFWPIGLLQLLKQALPSACFDTAGLHSDIKFHHSVAEFHLYGGTAGEDCAGRDTLSRSTIFMPRY